MSSSTRSKREPPVPMWLFATSVVLFVIATLVASYLVFTTVRDYVAAWQVTGGTTFLADVPVNPQGTPMRATPTAVTLASIIPQKWTGVDRVTILLMGIDRRQGETEKGYLTDSLMLVTVDPVAQTAAILSVPRDLWVEIPGYENNTINTANRTGDYYDYPGGGPALAAKTVQHNLGVSVNYYVRLDFTAFETFVDLIGGIDVNVTEAIDDPYYPDGSYGFEPFYLTTGPHHLNGHDALRYARSRHNSSDIDRAKRQQEVVLAVREKVLNQNMLPTLLSQAPRLYQTLNESVQTNLSLEQGMSLALLAQEIDKASIKHEVIDYRYVLEQTTPEGRQVLIPLRDRIRELRDELFTAPAVIANVPTNATQTSGDDKFLLQTEGARIKILNGAGVEGLARTTSDWLTQEGLVVTSFDTADRIDYTQCIVLDYTGRKPFTAHWLARTFNANLISGSDASSEVDIVVILGSNWQIPNK